MNLRRILRHLLMTQWQVRRAFPRKTLHAIERATSQAESTRSGEIRFAVEGALAAGPLLAGQTARERAIEVFSQLRVWDTEHNNGVLIYLLLADRDVEIVADRGINAKVTVLQWEEICRQMERAFGAGCFQEGSLAGIQAVGELLRAHYNATRPGANELPDKPVVM